MEKKQSFIEQQAHKALLAQHDEINRLLASIEDSMELRIMQTQADRPDGLLPQSINFCDVESAQFVAAKLREITAFLNGGK